jgi:exopolyphosphatase/guanosine-5'-triphosphate,3'-diphosphate pyrophosphatase
VRLKTGKKSLRIDFPRGWLDRHPLTRADLDQERDFLAEAGLRLDFS